MSEVWEQEIMKTNYWMLDETPGLVGVEDKEGNRRYLNRYFWGIKAKLKKLCWFIYEHGRRGLKAIKSFLDNFIGFFTSDGYVVYSIYQDLYPDKHRSSCLYHIRRYFVDAIEESHAFMFSAIESCDINRLSPETYLRKLILGLHEKKVEKKQLLPCYIRL